MRSTKQLQDSRSFHITVTRASFCVLFLWTIFTNWQFFFDWWQAFDMAWSLNIITRRSYLLQCKREPRQSTNLPAGYLWSRGSIPGRESGPAMEPTPVSYLMESFLRREMSWRLNWLQSRPSTRLWMKGAKHLLPFLPLWCTNEHLSFTRIARAYQNFTIQTNHSKLYRETVAGYCKHHTNTWQNAHFLMQL